MAGALIGKRPLGPKSLAVAFLAVALVAGSAHLFARANEKYEETTFEVVKDETRGLNDDQLGEIVRDFGEHLRDTMDEEMDKLINEAESKPAASVEQPLSEAELVKLKEVNKAVGEDIKARIELAGDNKGALPQAGLGSKATSFVAAASGRLAAAGSYIGNKMRVLNSNVARRIPAKLRRFFKWPTFLKFKIRFHKTYKSLREELYRQMIFMKTHIVVGMQHLRFLLRRDKHLTGQNQFSDMTNQEYHLQMNNAEAEVSADQLASGSAVKLDEPTVAKLKYLQRAGKNIFGGRVILGAARRSRAAGLRRKRRSLEEEDYYLNAELEEEDHNRMRRRRERRAVSVHLEDGTEEDEDEDDDELNDNEDEDSYNSIIDTHSMSGDSEPDDNDEDPKRIFELVDEFANGVDLSGLDDIENTVDDALNLNDGFKPIDLRDTGCIIKPENQNGCGCCYSYAINAAASYYNCMEQKRNRADRYHARFVSDCGKYLTEENKLPSVNGCRGGRISQAYKFAQMLGVQRFADYNIARVSAKVYDSDTCAYPRPESLEKPGWSANVVPVPSFQRARFTLLKLNEIDLHLRTVGPVFVNARTWKSFKNYEAGIYDSYDEDDSSVLHSMLIVGHDRDSEGRDYYIVLNSHGIVWGESGFLRIYQDSLEYFSALYGGLSPL